MRRQGNNLQVHRQEWLSLCPTCAVHCLMPLIGYRVPVQTFPSLPLWETEWVLEEVRVPLFWLSYHYKPFKWQSTSELFRDPLNDSRIKKDSHCLLFSDLEVKMQEYKSWMKGKWWTLRRRLSLRRQKKLTSIRYCLNGVHLHAPQMYPG